MAPSRIRIVLAPKKLRASRGSTSNVKKSGDNKYSESNKKIQQPVPATSFPLNRVPAEIQTMIWSEVIKMPACHTFKIVKDDQVSAGSAANPWALRIMAKEPRHDPSAYRLWKKLHQLHNISFEAAFRFLATNIQPLALHLPGSRQPTYAPRAAIDSSNDLVIFDFERGSRQTLFSWFEHTGVRSTMNIRLIRSRFRHFTRVALHYRDSHVNADLPGPFQCYCQPPVPMRCHRYKACPLELACFLDCFRNLKEFYLIVQPRRQEEIRFAAEYKKNVDHAGLCIPRTRISGHGKTVGPFKLSQFFDTKYEYIQQAPPKLMPLVRTRSPFYGPGSARDCLIKAWDIYKGTTGDEEFRTPQEQRDQSKIGYNLRDPCI
ncbi:hypothetical protein M406DRAFT_331847 [Cryphonectria parasitica EP155]|uniref:Uncharacterized protein n=1 Tax=Cryphonectria parasitica (strain ATCC 38755 / EP155) TaxID=660469 RepID=A0A9P4XYM9_CRYP1|nr:uncharacterized protein M406DRAFT_331847 [Cryphonectria parasitica EP155]KAF3763319.1 hypothetical protein M406DRAFT_331847 [Cryphonectria parasitica EP155]